MARLLPSLLALFCAFALPAQALITWKRVQLADTFYAEGANFGDINRDGRTDIISGPFWYEGPDWRRKHAFYEPQAFSIEGYSDNFFCYAQDFTGDGWQDILVIGFPGKEARLYVNPGGSAEDQIWPVHIVADVVDGESPGFLDITGDGKPEIVCGSGGSFGYYAPEWEKPTAKWRFTALTPDLKIARFTHGMGVGDVNGDGKPDLLEARRWWENGPAPEWKQHNFAAGVGGGAQMFAYDFDGDGRNDVATALQAHRYGVAVFLNRAGSEGAQWEQRLLVGEHPWNNEYGVLFSQPHAMHLADIDGDGIKDLVTGKRYWAHNGHDPDEREARVVYWFKTQRDGRGGVEFVPHLIDDRSGVGVDVQVGDANGDEWPDIVVGNKSGVYVLLQERREVSAEVAQQMKPKKLYGSALIPQSDYKAGQSAREALGGMQLPTGFKADLIAAEPEVVQPIAMCWDERGRLWVVEGNSYPKPREPGAGQDRILILEDADGNGSFETRKVFAEGISLASGIEVGFGGVWLGAAPYLMFIADRDRDDKPDTDDVPNPAPGLKFKARILLDGWGSQDTHETLNSFVWGPDGWLYGCHGVFTHSKVGPPGTPEERREKINAGVWRYHPVRHVFEVYAHGTSNPWGLDYDQNGEFFVTACVIPHLYHIVPGGRYQRQAGQHFNPYTFEDIKTVADHAHYIGDIRGNAHWGSRAGGGLVADDTNEAGGGHAHCGLAIYQSSHFPAIYRNSLIFGNLHGHRIVADYVDVKGSTYTGKHGADFMRANDLHFIPVTQKVGPDGALYVSDWSDKQICHRGSGAVELWDRSNGRIYRVSYAGWQPWKGDLSKESDQALANLIIQKDNDWLARMARRVLVERYAGGRAPDSLMQGLSSQGAAARGKDATLGALWAFESLVDVAKEGAFLNPDYPANWPDSLTSPRAESRVWAIRLAATRGQISNTFLDVLEDTAKEDKSTLVRRELASLLQRLPTARRSAIALPLLGRAEDKDDPYIPLLIWYGIEPLVGADAQAALKLAMASKMPKVTGFIYRRMSADEAGRAALIGMAAESRDGAQKQTLIQTVVESARAGNKVSPPTNWGELKARLGAIPLVPELEAFMGVEQSLAAFRAKLTESAPAAEREAALRILLQVRDTRTAERLHQLMNSSDKGLVRRVVQALATLPHENTPGLLLENYATFDTGIQGEVVNTLATTPAGAKGLLMAVREGKLPLSMISPFLARQMDALNDADVRRLVGQVWGNINAPKADLPLRKQKFRALLSADAIAKADLVKGRLIYGATCGACHTLFGEGQKVGPDLTGSNRRDLNYLLDNVLDPNAVIGKDYQLSIFELTGGRLTSGVIKEETAVAFRIAMPGGLEQLVKKEEIKKRTLSPASTMPEGLFDALPPEALLQLVAYLQSRGTDAATAAAKSAPGVLEGESLRTKASGGTTRPQPMGNFKAGRWSGGKHLWWTGGKPGDKLAIHFSAAKAGKQKVYAVFTKAPDYAKVTLAVDGKASALGEFDLYDPAVVNTAEQFLGEYDLSAGEHTLEVAISGRNEKAKPSHMFALDYLRLE